jgi:hypothetical protein
MMKIKTTLTILGSIAVSASLFGARASDSYTIEAEGLLPQTSFAAGSYVLEGTLAPFSGSSAGSYTLLAGVNPSSNTLIAIPTIEGQPSETVDLLEGETLTLSVDLSGPGPYAFQWSKDGEAIEDATVNPLEVTGVNNDDEGDYSVVVSNPFGDISSLTASVSVLAKPVLLAELADIEGEFGGSADFVVEAEVEGTAAYQWFKDGVEIAGEVASVLSLSDLDMADVGTYSVEISNEAGTVSSSAELTIEGLPPTEGPAALVGSPLLSVDGTISTYESDWFGVFSIDSEGDFGWVYTTPLGWTYFTSISTREASYIYPLLVGGILYTNESLYPSYAYSYDDASWIFLPPFNDAETGSIWAWVYALGDWKEYSE